MGQARASGTRPGQRAAGDPRLIGRLLATLEEDVLPLTEAGVRAGNKVFGAAILKKDDLSLVVAGTNQETLNPLWHGEIQTLKQLYELPRAARPAPRDCLFLASHEPCTLCLSAITWGGYDNFYYLYSHEDSRDSFAIGHDLVILKEVFGLAPGHYARSNAYWQGYWLLDLIAGCEAPARQALLARVARIKARYDALSTIYQQRKHLSDIPLK